MQTLRVVFGLAALCVAVSAQCTLSTPFNANNGQNGNMFDLVATAAAPIEVFGFSGAFDAGTHTVEIYARTGGGSHVGAEGNPGAWTLLGSATVTSTGRTTPTPIPVALNLVIPAGATQGMYITTNDPFSNVGYTNGTALGAVAASDSNLQVLEGRGVVYPFGPTFTPRVWNGIVSYRVQAPFCPVTPWQMNQVGASLTFDGVQSTGRAPAITPKVAGAFVTLNLSSSTGLPYDVGLTACRNLPLGGGGILLPSGTQVVNLNILDPSFRWLGPGTFAGPFLPFGLPFGISFPAPARSLSMQMAALDPSAPEGVSLSQAATVAVGNGEIQMPLGDDNSAIVSLISGPTCFGPFPFAGTTFTEVSAETNGRIRFASSLGFDFSPSLGEALSEDPFFGYWTDLVNDLGAGRVVSDGAAGLTFQYINNRHFGSSTNNISFDLILDFSTGNVAISNMLSIPASTRNMFLGLSIGNRGAIDLGPVASFNSGSVGNSVGGSMLYQFGAGAPSIGNVSTIIFRPVGSIDYSYFAF